MKRRILLVCAFMPAMLAESLEREASVKEGWADAAVSMLLKEPSLEVSLAFAVSPKEEQKQGRTGNLNWYTFPEDFGRLEEYPLALEKRALEIVRAAVPELVHLFGTEYPHCLAFARAFPHPARLLVSLQGIMAECAAHYRAGLSDRVWNTVTIRDFLKKDSLVRQQEKFAKRAGMEWETLSLCGHAAGRTAFDREAVLKIAPRIRYHHLGETLRSVFYAEDAEGKKSFAAAAGAETRQSAKTHPFSIFLSQGNYPLKGAHRLLEALPELITRFPETKVTIAGDKITAAGSLKERLKRSAYGKYLLALSGKYPGKVCFTGKLSAEEMKKEMLGSHVFLVPSSIENSSNSLGEAMLLGVPAVCARVGGLPDMAEEGKEALFYDFDRPEEMLDAIGRLFAEPALCERIGEAAKKRAAKLFDPEKNRQELLSLYRELWETH